MKPETFHLRTEEDLLALIPVTLGFHPCESLVMVSVDHRSMVFQARVDLPEHPEDLTEVVALLRTAAVRNHARLAFLVAYTDDDRMARRCTRRLGQGLDAHRIETLMRLRVSDGRWYPLLPRSSADHRVRTGVAFDLSGHELSARSVYAGEVVHADRAALVATIAPTDPERVEAVLLAHKALDALQTSDRSALTLEGEWLQRQVLEQVSTAQGNGDGRWSIEETARVLRAIELGTVRDYALCLVNRENAREHLALWRLVVPDCPDDLVAPAAALMAFAAWAHGDGALAWVGVERAWESDPEHSLARLVADFLDAAVSPKSGWPLPPEALGLIGSDDVAG